MKKLVIKLMGITTLLMISQFCWWKLNGIRFDGVSMLLLALLGIYSVIALGEYERIQKFNKMLERRIETGKWEEQKRIMNEFQK